MRQGISMTRILVRLYRCIMKMGSWSEFYRTPCARLNNCDKNSFQMDPWAEKGASSSEIKWGCFKAAPFSGLQLNWRHLSIAMSWTGPFFRSGAKTHEFFEVTLIWQCIVCTAMFLISNLQAGLLKKWRIQKLLLLCKYYQRIIGDVKNLRSQDFRAIFNCSRGVCEAPRNF